MITITSKKHCVVFPDSSVVLTSTVVVPQGNRESSGIEKAIFELSGSKIKLLVNNAGVCSNEGIDSLDFDSIRNQFEVNTLAPLRLTVALMEYFDVGSKIAMITSQMGSIDDNESGQYYGYRMSKAALNIAGKSLSIDLRDRGIVVGLFHPGYVKTDMTSHMGMITPVESARGLISRIDELNSENSGTFWHQNGEVLPW